MPRYRIDPRKLEVMRGRIIVALGRDLAWFRLSQAAGLSTNTLSNILHGRSGGRAATVRALTDYARKVGVPAKETDLLSPVEEGESVPAPDGAA